MKIDQQNFEQDILAINSIDSVPAILEVICKTTGMGFAAVARVTDQKWIACAVRDEIQFGLKPGGELLLETTICNEIRQSNQAVIIDHVAEDPAFSKHPTPELYGFQSYISVPIQLKNGEFFGTLCAVDPKPAKLKAHGVEAMFRLYAELIATHLDAADQLKFIQLRLQEERRMAILRDKFIAVLGHDLMNPVGAVSNAAQMLLRMPLNDSSKRLTAIVQQSAFRMRELIDNILDFARGNLGGGIQLRKSLEYLEPVLQQVVTELRLVYPDHPIETSFDLDVPVYCDAKRIAQLFSNLLGNALKHGMKGEPVQVIATGEQHGLMLSVSNSGEQIPEHIRKNLFKPFVKGDTLINQQGLGLGLYIAAEIAQAHGGMLEVESTAAQTCFTFNYSF